MIAGLAQNQLIRIYIAFTGTTEALRIHNSELLSLGPISFMG